MGRTSRGGNRRTVGTRFDMRTAKAQFLEHWAAGLTVESAVKRVGRSLKTYEHWRRDDLDFKAQVDLIRTTRKVGNGDRQAARAAAKLMGFAAFRKKYLNTETFWHQHQWIDLVEGREPRDLHPAETYEPGRRGRLLINVPPNHSKTTTLTIDYSVYRICCEPNIRIAVLSETEGMAKKFLAEVKDKLTQPKFADLIKDFAPEGGFRTSAEIWGATQVKVADRTDASKDPTIEAIGIGGQIYGTRLDLIFLDDCINSENASRYQQQMDWLRREVLSRPGPAGRVIVVGTRIAAYDLYGQLMNPDNYGGRTSPWTYLAQPAVLEPASEVNPQGKTLWPYASVPWVEPGDLDVCELCGGQCSTPTDIDGQLLFPRWDMTHLLNGPKADAGDEKSWQIIYQQRAIPEDSTFPEYAVMGCVNNRRRHGANGGLDTVPEDAYYLGSLDPATSGNAFGLVLAVDRKTGMRYVVDALNMKAPSPEAMKDLVKRWSNEYPIRQWRIEKTGLLTMFTQDRELNAWLATRGIVFKRHYTGNNKWDTDFGVASMSTLFGSWEPIQDGGRKEIEGTRFIEFPRLDTSSLTMLVNQLINWTPALDPKKIPCDGVMALWFAEIAARELLKVGRQYVQTHVRSKFLNPRQLARQQVVDFHQYKNLVAA